MRNELDAKIDLGNIGSIEVANGEANVSASLDVPSPSMKENEKYPFTPWNVDQLEKQAQKDLKRLAQTVSNFLYVSALVSGRNGTRTTVRAEKTIEQLKQKLAAAQAKLQAAQAPQIEA